MFVHTMFSEKKNLNKNNLIILYNFIEENELRMFSQIIKIAGTA